MLLNQIRQYISLPSIIVTNRGGTLGISGWGCAAVTLEPLTYTRATILDKINGKPRPRSSPNQEWGKLGVFAFRAPLSLIRGDGGLLFHFILSKIVVQLNFATLY